MSMINKFEKNRLSLHDRLLNLFEITNVYYQPPTNVQMKFPCIVYERENINNSFANNGIYSQTNSYKVTVIDKDPDSIIVNKLVSSLNSRFVRHFNNGNLNHYVFIIHYNELN